MLLKKQTGVKEKILLAALIAPLTLSTSFPAYGQISSDGTLPTNVTGADGRNFTIDGGAQVGGNLFHSFRDFSVPTGGEAFFNNGADINNIINRVTGGNFSNIDGLLRANGAANLFLINPAGIVFGPNARLDIGGSFMGTTASGLLFADGAEFGVLDGSGTPLLTVNQPVGLQFRGNEGGIVNRSVHVDGTGARVGLRVPDGQSLSLISGGGAIAPQNAGGLSLEGGIITATGGRVELGALAGAGTVGLNDDGSVTFPQGVPRSDVSLTNGGFADVRAGGGGTIEVNARNLTISGGGGLFGGIGPGLGTPETRAGDITINATGTVTVTEGRISNVVGTGAVGNAGDINITTGSLAVNNGGELLTRARKDEDEVEGQVVEVEEPVRFANAGNVRINATEAVIFDNGFVSALVGRNIIGDGGDIEITAGSLSASNGSRLINTMSGTGNAGNIIINVEGAVVFDNSPGLTEAGEIPVGAFSNLQREGTGRSGNITINAGSLSVINGSQLNANTSGMGNAGNINITAQEKVAFEGSEAFSRVRPPGNGSGGNITINAGLLSLTTGATLSSQVQRSENENQEKQGNAGNVIINARDTVTLDNGFINTNVGGRVTGDSGDITINVGSFSAINGSQLISIMSGTGEAGNIIISAEETVVFDGFTDTGIPVGAFSNLQENGTGEGGDIIINAGSLSVINGSQLVSSTSGRGNAGSVNINAEERVTFAGTTNRQAGAFSRVRETGNGQGGNVNITADSILLQDRGEIAAENQGTGNAGNLNLKAEDKLELRSQSRIRMDNDEGDGGNINIDTPLLLTFPEENTDITANAEQGGTGGQIDIAASGVLGIRFREVQSDETNDITASSTFGRQGEVSFSNPDSDLSAGLVELSDSVLDPNAVVASACPTNTEEEETSTFEITGRGGLPPNPANPLTGETVRVGGAVRAETPVLTVAQNETEIVPARGWMVNEEGVLVLTSYATPNSDRRSANAPKRCP